MGESHVGVTEYHNHTTLHPVGLIAVLVLGCALVLLPRRYAILPMIVLGCFIPSAQRLIVMGADFSLLRILVLFGWARLLLRNEFSGYSWNRLDSMVVAWKLSGTLIYIVQQGSFSALIYKLGWMFDGFGMYFLFRCLIRDWKDLSQLAFCFILVSFPVAWAFVIESQTGRNAFSIFGGVSAITHIRDGRLRCQGAFSHSILAGVYWASLMPLMISSLARKEKWLAVGGIVANMIVVVTCASSTPIMSVGLVIIGMLLYPLRHHRRAIRNAFWVSLIVLHFTMKNPVWHLLAKADIIGGSTGWHRYKIMDATINNFSQWWLWGESNAMSWGIWQMRDITNQYILEALLGGLLTLVFFVYLIVVAFGIVGKVLPRCEGNPSQLMCVWCIGVTLLVHVGTYFGVSYFGQTIMLWYLTLAMIGSLPGISEVGQCDVRAE